jgi:multidrug resistance efflux pump
MKKLYLIPFGLIGIACASDPAPKAAVASATASVRGAEEAGALSVPEAALHLKLAKEELKRSHELSDIGSNERAQSQAVRAYEDAELALALARKQEAQKRLKTLASSEPSAGGDSSELGVPGMPSPEPLAPPRQPAK